MNMSGAAWYLFSFQLVMVTVGPAAVILGI
jgi:hypothetical protein